MARLDTGWHEHPKVLALGLAAMGLHAWSISYCDATRSDGLVPAGSWPALPGVRAAVFALLRAGLWEPADGGYRLHDYADYNRTRAQIEAGQAASTERVKRWRNTSRNGGETRPETSSPSRARSSPGPGPFNPPGSSPAGSGPAREDTDPQLLAEHLKLIARDRASRGQPSQPDSKSLENGETNGA